MAITTQDIHAAADKIVEEGGKPTLSAVRKELKGGSFTTISDAMQDWKSKKSVHTAAPIHEAAPASVGERLTAFGSEIWSIALDMANSRLQSEREGLEQVRQVMEETQKEAIDLADQLNGELEQAQSIIEQQIETLTKVGAESDQLSKKYEVERVAKVAELETEKIARIDAERKSDIATAALTEVHLQVTALNTQISELKMENKELRAVADNNYKKYLETESSLSIMTERLASSKSEIEHSKLDLDKYEKALAEKDRLLKEISLKLESMQEKMSEGAQAAKLLEGKQEAMEKQIELYHATYVGVGAN